MSSGAANHERAVGEETGRAGAPATLQADDARDDQRAGNFVADRVRDDLARGKNEGRVMTRFPPEPNGYLHIGHAKSICLNFGLAEEFGGVCNLRFDDTNPSTEDVEYVESIKADVRWLGFEWDARQYFASDYFEELYRFAEELIQKGLAYVDSRPLDEIRQTRGDFHRPGEDSPFRGRSPEENLALFRRMRTGEFPDGAHVLRAKIDMASTDLKLRDPVMYRIKHERHHRTGDAWCIYPMYDWAHGLSDAIEGVTHSICTLEFVNHRALYHWFIDHVSAPCHPEQIEFARLNLSYTVLSKRRLQELVAKKLVDGWDDPRMPTLAGLRRRGVTPAAIRRFCDRIGVSKNDGVVDVGLFDHEIREDLNATSPRVMGVLRPIELVLENFDEAAEIELDAPYFQDEPERGTRKVVLSKVLYVERDDFMEEAPKKWFRLAPGREVRLRYGCLVTCTRVEKDALGEVVRLYGTWDPDSLGGTAKDGRKVRGTIHWVPARRALTAEVRLYDRLFLDEDPMEEREGQRWQDRLNPRSLEVLRDARLEPSLSSARPGDRVQLERLGYFVVDDHATPDRVVLNRTIDLRDSWSKIASKLGAEPS